MVLCYACGQTHAKKKCLCYGHPDRNKDSSVSFKESPQGKKWIEKYGLTNYFSHMKKELLNGQAWKGEALLTVLQHLDINPRVLVPMSIITNTNSLPVQALIDMVQSARATWRSA